MPTFGRRSREQLETLHPSLKSIMIDAIRITDFSILEGFRGEEKQNEAFIAGRSKKRWGESKHNQKPSLAVDIGPYSRTLGKIDWEDERGWYLLAGVIISVAYYKGVVIRWGGDWDSDWNLGDQTFNDLGHFELVEV